MLNNKLSEFKKDLSAVSRSLRSDYRAGRIQIVEAANKTKFFDDDLSNAIELLTEAYERDPNARVLELIGEYHVNLGQNVIARSIFRDCLATYGKLHITNIIFAGIEATVALVDDSKKLLYIALPKCGSSSVKNYFTHARFGKTYGEQVHFQHNDMYRIVTAQELSTTYRDYHKFTVVRDPVSRVTSYFTSNLVNRALRREAHGCDHFMGLVTAPGPRMVAHHFYQYRQMFIDFRHHTDGMSGYLRGMLPHLNAVYHMRDLPAVRAMLSDAYRVEIPDERSMVTKGGGDQTDLCNQEFARFKDFYAEDYKQFF